VVVKPVRIADRNRDLPTRTARESPSVAHGNRAPPAAATRIHGEIGVRVAATMSARSERPSGRTTVRRPPVIDHVAVGESEAVGC